MDRIYLPASIAVVVPTMITFSSVVVIAASIVAALPLLQERPHRPLKSPTDPSQVSRAGPSPQERREAPQAPRATSQHSLAGAGAVEGALPGEEWTGTVGHHRQVD